MLNYTGESSSVFPNYAKVPFMCFNVKWGPRQEQQQTLHRRDDRGFNSNLPSTAVVVLVAECRQHTRRMLSINSDIPYLDLHTWLVPGPQF